MPTKIYDVSVPIHSGMHVYPGDPRFRARPVRSLADGDSFQLHKIALGNHTGTHVDAPLHFLKDGPTITDLPLEVMNGRARVIQVHNTEKIDVPELREILLVDDFRVLFKTKNSLLWNSRKHFSKDYAYLTPEAAQYLTENGIKLIGFDYLSVDRYGDTSYPVHKILLQNQVVLIESLNLSEVDEGEYELFCLPLPLSGMDAAPARVILRK